MTGTAAPDVAPLINDCNVVLPPALDRRNPATQFAAATGPSYSPPIKPSDAAVSTRAPCSSTMQPPSSICSTAASCVPPSLPVPPLKTSLPALAYTADGFTTDHFTAESSEYSSSNHVTLG